MSLKNLYLFCVAALMLLNSATSCKKDKSYDELPKEQLEKLSTQKYAEIKSLIGNHSCENSSDWKIATITGVCSDDYILYHKSINEKELNLLIADYNKIITSYARIVLAYTSCSTEIKHKPTGVNCTDGRAELKY